MAEVYSPLRQPVVTGDKSLAQVTQDVAAPLERGPTALWWLAFLAALSVLALGVTAVSYQIATGIGTWGLNRSVGWAFDITNFIFWIGIGHAGTGTGSPRSACRRGRCRSRRRSW